MNREGTDIVFQYHISNCSDDNTPIVGHWSYLFAVAVDGSDLWRIPVMPMVSVCVVGGAHVCVCVCVMLCEYVRHVDEHGCPFLHSFLVFSALELCIHMHECNTHTHVRRRAVWILGAMGN